jgi:hypothetical protein
MTPSENILRAVRFETPERIPMTFHINAACWHHYDQQQLQSLMADHPLLFPGYEIKEKIEPVYGPCQRAGVPYTDDWGCVWETADDGIVGTVTQHPLASWDTFDSYAAPDPEKVMGVGPIDWEKVKTDFAAAKAEGRIACGGLRHGHTFLQLCDIRGYQNLLFDMVDEEPHLPKLIEMLEEFNLGLITRYIAAGATWMSYPEDLGMQIGPMISPEHFVQYIKPSYQRMMKPARDAGCIIHMHSDGDIRDLVDEIIDGGVEIINLQDLVNGIDWIKEHLAGKTCIDLDIDRQDITRFGTPEQIDALIREEVQKIGCKEGGLTMIYGLYPEVPLENVKALMDAMERYSTYYSS